MTRYPCIYTDGSCHPNPGPGGWATVLVLGEGKRPRVRNGGELGSTNNRMELRAAIEALRIVTALDQEVDVITDSQYVRRGITDYVNDWRTNGWRLSSGGPVKNIDLWQELDELHLPIRWKVRWLWVRGHAGHEMNELADQAAAQGRRSVL